MTRVFISYRRADSSRAADDMVAALERRRGLTGLRSIVFRDEAAIIPGEDWRKRVMQEVESCDWLVAVIGPQWLAPGANGQPRIQQRDDMVRIEIATALRGGIPVLPVKLAGAYLPDIRELPTDIAMVTRHQGLRWPEDSDRLIATVSKRAKGKAVSVPDLLVGTWVHATPTLGSTYAFSTDGTYSHMGFTEQRSPREVYRFEVWEEGIAVVARDRISLQPFRAEATQSSSDNSRPNYRNSPRELINRELRWRVRGGGSSRILELISGAGEVTRFEFQGKFE